MKVLWKSDLGQGKHDPLEITHVVTKSGSQIAADLVVPFVADGSGAAWAKVDNPAHAPDADDGLLEVIEAQLAAIDQMATAAKFMVDMDVHTAQTKELTDLKEWADQFPYLVEELCAALGFARNPVGPTGIPELDRIVGLAR